MKGNSILFKNVNVIDCDNERTFNGDVLVEGNRIKKVAEGGGILGDGDTRVIEGNGRTLMSTLCDAHTHLSWNSGDLDFVQNMPVEEHMLVCVESAKMYIDAGYTMCVGAASAKNRLDIVIRDAINAGRFPGPRYLANAMELATSNGLLLPKASNVVDGVDQVRKVAREIIGSGVDMIKLILSGEEITTRVWAQQTFFDDDEVAVVVKEAHRCGVRVSAHARSAESIKMCLRNGVDVIYHASYIDDEGMDMLEAKKDTVFVAPGLNWITATLEDAGQFGYSSELAEKVGYKRELENAVRGLTEMHKRGIKILPGGDYGFLWTPHGTYAKDLQIFVERLGWSTMDTIRAATVWGGEIMNMPNDLGKVKEGYLADLLLVDGDPLKDIKILQDKKRLHGIMKDGKFHKDPMTVGTPYEELVEA
ncbi:amidohydrolase family protein [Mucilaginibacter sp.]|uniref:metal-dependent hydrolase family protein n=1 Tax=Mucilaginibacter sp. TaxID=1882438 RepID=UPI00262713DF|nr:amidohydrolase family protein [Mucilaginibacter sp.]MDB4926519.1 amidohydrolase [Mucilaginibacter sp.]